MIDAKNPAQVRACFKCHHLDWINYDVPACACPALHTHAYSRRIGVMSERYMALREARDNEANCGLAGRYWTPRRSVWQRVRAWWSGGGA